MDYTVAFFTSLHGGAVNGYEIKYYRERNDRQ